MGDTTEPTVQVPVSLIEDLHARWHDEPGNMLGRSDCGWQGCMFYDAAEFTLSQPTASAAAHFCTPGCTDENCPVEPFSAVETAELRKVLRARPGFDPSTIRDVAPPTPTT
ncbi:hypothetical protein NYQ35_15980 [Curtobacterium flaccumfaciens pv. flaccumfaciens]|uniref:hypothetical protein n=1 Tax=Curtobacterium flaccumfaciens TaxID=2035 RepID=UPI00217F164E|nr:hypothetical protein [Curtobacterium flaccumfaciens]MCS6570305.1 hypothetical protein [Curtobacterium flaccumfaciens pv. flaccumfaciens]MCS6585161.1 hypothetical protein [Curtobacterium flaccumfaciens pv. flaccumfaciens]